MKSRKALVTTSSLMGLLGFSLPVLAATLYVDGTGGSNGGNTCSNAANPCATIQHAIDAAQPGDTIQIANAVYTEILTVDKALALSGESREGTIIQAAAARGAAADRVISVNDDIAFELSDATVRHGNTGLNGGGVECIGGDLLLERVTFSDNDADGRGAGLASGDNVVVMTDVVFVDNGNSATSDGGGAFLGENFVVTDVTLNNVRFENNVAAAGAGLKLSNAQAALSNVLFAGNTSSGEGGGVFYEGSNSVVSSLAIMNAAFIGNSAGDGGGGMYTQSDDTPYDLVNVLFSGNLANLGGGIYNQAGLAAGDRVLTNVTISGNRAQLRGGGIDRPFDMRLRNTVIWNNADASGAGTPESTMDDFFSDSVVEVSNSLLQGYPAGEFPGSSNLDGTDAGNNPLFRQAVNPNGAPSLAGNLRLQLDSPVRDAGNNAFVSGIATDLDGEARVVNGIVDLGAFEGTDVLFADGFEEAGF
jgi:predicted outer membrane repeat protein